MPVDRSFHQSNTTAEHVGSQSYSRKKLPFAINYRCGFAWQHNSPDPLNINISIGNVEVLRVIFNRRTIDHAAHTKDVFVGVIKKAMRRFSVSASSARFLIITFDGFGQGVMNYEPDV